MEDKTKADLRPRFVPRSENESTCIPTRSTGKCHHFFLAVTLVLVFTRLVMRRKAPAVAVTCLVVAILIVGGENYFVTILLR